MSFEKAIHQQWRNYQRETQQHRAYKQRLIDEKIRDYYTRQTTQQPTMTGVILRNQDLEVASCFRFSVCGLIGCAISFGTLSQFPEDYQVIPMFTGIISSVVSVVTCIIGSANYCIKNSYSQIRPETVSIISDIERGKK